jgi:DNA-binding CsgD family transcriptional regulator/tetratricopeptide (TPR) repeat protein
VLAYLFGDRAESIAAAGRDLGFLAPRVDDSLDLHPLLGSFLQRKLRESHPDRVGALAQLSASYFIARRDWDSAYWVIGTHDATELLPKLLREALDELLKTGRVSTLSEWIAKAADPCGPEVELVRAEIAFRQGSYLAAEVAAKRAAQEFDQVDPWCSRAWCRAGQAAYFRDDLENALSHFEQAQETATNASDMKAALWGMFHAAAVADHIERARRDLEQIAEVAEGDATDHVRILNGRIAIAVRVGTIHDVLLDVEAGLTLLEDIDDAVIRTSFLNSAAHVFLLAGYFKRAHSVVEEEIAEAERCGLSFVLPHAIARKASAEIGLRDFSAAEQTLASRGSDFEDPYSRVIIAATRVRLSIASGTLDEFEPVPDSLAARGPAATHAEYLASVALWHACRGERRLALERLIPAVLKSSSLEPRLFSACAGAAIRAADGSASRNSIERLAKLTVTTGCIEPTLCAIRGCPRLLDSLLAVEEGIRAPLRRIAEESADPGLARALGIRFSSGANSLTPREREVHALLGEGLTNKAIAKRLFISESTAKVHVRKLMEKLGVKTRTAAALKYRGQD